MGNTARKSPPSSKRKSSGRGASKSGAKARPVARVSEGARGELAVLASDPEFQRRVAQQLVVGDVAVRFAQIVAAAAAKAKRAPAVSDDAMRAASEFMAEVAKHNGPPPSDDEVDEMVRAWA